MSSGEDFSFPTITDPLPHFAKSPSLWRVSPLVHPDYEDEVDFANHERSPCLEIHQVKITESSREEKMDMLWEDLNEEQQLRVSALEEKAQSESSKERKLLRCVDKCNGALCRPRRGKRLGIVGFKVGNLKQIFRRQM